MSEAPPPQACCDMMAQAIDPGCEQHKDDPANCPDALVTRHSDGKLGIPVRDGGASHVEINFCPWCGRPLGKESLGYMMPPGMVYNLGLRDSHAGICAIARLKGPDAAVKEIAEALHKADPDNPHAKAILGK